MAPLGSLTLVANVVLAPLMQKEQISRQDLFATGLIVGGCSLAVAFASHKDCCELLAHINTPVNNAHCYICLLTPVLPHVCVVVVILLLLLLLVLLLTTHTVAVYSLDTLIELYDRVQFALYAGTIAALIFGGLLLIRWMERRLKRHGRQSAKYSTLHLVSPRCWSLVAGCEH